MNGQTMVSTGVTVKASGTSFTQSPTSRKRLKRGILNASAFFSLLLLLGMTAAAPAMAQGPDCSSNNGKPCVDFGVALDAGQQAMELPLQKATKVKINHRRQKEKNWENKAKDKVTRKCLEALEANDEEEIAKRCSKSPKHAKQEKPFRNEPIIGHNGKQKGKSIKTRTTLEFDKPSQRYGNKNKDTWDNIVFKPPKTGDLTASHWRGQSNTRDKRRNSTFGFVDESVQGGNDDNDCVDSFTGEHMGGKDIPDGAADSCFDENGNLKLTLTPVGDQGCQHQDGTYFYGPPYQDEDEDEEGKYDENDCYYYPQTDPGTAHLKTTLVELIDEDGTSTDLDGDGQSGEDPPNPGGEAINDDQDCIDTVTGRRFRKGDCFESGKLRTTLQIAYFGCEDAAGEYQDGNPYDGEEDACFSAFDEEDVTAGTPVEALLLDPVNTTALAEGCVHCLGGKCPYDGSGIFFEGDPDADNDGDGRYDENDCYYYPQEDPENLYLKNTLAELIDEDDGIDVDDDGDGWFGEDPPDSTSSFESECHKAAKRLADDDNFDLSDVYTDDGGCDLTRAIIVGANKKALNHKDGGEKFYKANAQGYFDDSVGGTAKEYGKEPRTLVLDEEFTLLCGAGEIFDEPTGQCLPETQEAALIAYRSSTSHSPAGLDGSLNGYAMMGFTFAPPRLRWGLFYKEVLDLGIFEFTLFEAKIGYDFALGVGFRLPVEVEVSNLPLSPILAEQHIDPVSEVRPENFSAADYRSFCKDNAMGNPAYCQRFAFPNALDSTDGDELAIRMTAFAGIKVVILEIPLINWGVDVDMDLPEMCSLFLAYQAWDDVFAEMSGGVGFAQALANLNMNCGSYITPYGNDAEGEPLQFPFIQNAPIVNQMIRADCAEAFARGETIKLSNGEVIPLCTGIILGIHGASLGLGVGTDLEMGSNLIKAKASATGDAIFLDHKQQPDYRQALDFNAAGDGGSEQVAIETMQADNYDDSDTEDYARVKLDDFTYCLNDFSIRLKGQAMFGGILTIFPDFPDFTIYRLTLPLGGSCGIPIGQHASTKPVEFPVFVENYGTEVILGTDPADPNRVDDKTLKYPPEKNQPGGDFLVSVKNIGSFPGDFDNFSYDLSNQMDQAGPLYTFKIDPDNDHDTLIDEDDFGPAGALREERDEDGDGLADEDPPDSWQTTPPWADFNLEIIEQVPPHQASKDANDGYLTLKIRPFVHPSTHPGVYPFRVTADSTEAKDKGLATVDPSFNRRTGAADVGFIKVESFYDPRIAIQPAAPSAKPAAEVVYTFEGTNMGNSDDSMSIAVDFKDFNLAGCSLTDMGKMAECPYRAERTVIDAEAWTTVATLATQFGPLAPLGSETDTLTILVPRDWEGMENTTYQYEVTATSLEDSDPPTANAIVVEHTVIATKESMTRYIRHEIVDLIAEIEAANEAGIRTGGLLPISMKPALKKADQALESILAGKLSGASNALSSNIKIMEAFVHALDGFNGKEAKIPAEIDADWHARAAAIIEDLQVAEASEVTSD